MVVENHLIIEVIRHIDEILLQSFFKLLRPILIGHIVIRLVLSPLLGFSATSFICQIEIIIGKLIFVELVKLDPVVFDLLELLLSLSSLSLLAPPLAHALLPSRGFFFARHAENHAASTWTDAPPRSPAGRTR